MPVPELCGIALPGILELERIASSEATMCRVNLAFLTAGVFLVIASSTLAQTPPGQANLVHVEIGGLRNDKGKVMCALFSSANYFPKHANKPIMRSRAPIASVHPVYRFSAVAPST